MFHRALVLIAAVSLVLVAEARAQSIQELQQTAAYAAALQNQDGGFASESGGPSSLGATNGAVKVLLYTAGSIPDVPACMDYVKRCHDADSGGFAPTPGGEPDVHTTAIGLMLLGELKVRDEDMIAKAVDYLNKHAESFEDIRIAVAGLEGVNKKSDKFDAWKAQVEGMRNPDGTWGEGPSQAFETGGAAVALLRMGADFDKKDAVIAAMKEGQRPDGGWSKDAGPSDLGSSYRVARAFAMLKVQPDIPRLLAFIAEHRRPDGGYAATSDGKSNIGATYTSTIMIRWARQLSDQPANIETASYQPLFNGKDLDGWEGDTSLWKVRDGMLVGQSPGIDHNTFLATEKDYGDFKLQFSFRLMNGQGNSGVQFRSVRIPGHEMSGYQADIGENYWGCLYDESRRNKVLVQASDRALEAVHKDGWNHYVVQAIGNHITLSLNGVRSVGYTEQDEGIARDGKIAVQIHAGGPMEVQFKDMYIQPIPRPDQTGDATSPGFHLKTVEAPGGPRKYTVFVPEGYDGSKAVPVVLFLHGSGERGEDGIVSAQVGLGPAVAGNPSTFPAIAIFPQARRTWSADSEDAAGALAALEDVQAHYKTDPDRVILTGLSMGGHGSWQLAAAHPELFAAVVPVCGFSETDVVAKVKGLPIWTFVGDADNDRIVGSTRQLVRALREAGANLHSTEYRGIGHNSWDRAYSDPALIEWMMKQNRKAD